MSIACINTFTNHACSKAEENVVWFKPAYENEDGDGTEFLAFSPPFTHRVEVMTQLEVASRDIEAGEEILQDYSSFREEPDENYKKFLKTMCRKGVGLVADGSGDEL